MKEGIGTRWTKAGHDRLYLSDETVFSAVGLQYKTYGSGAIKSATIGGESISNSKAYKIKMSLEKVYVDMTSMTLHAPSEYAEKIKQYIEM